MNNFEVNHLIENIRNFFSELHEIVLKKEEELNIPKEESLLNKHEYFDKDTNLLKSISIYSMNMRSFFTFYIENLSFVSFHNYIRNIEVFSAIADYFDKNFKFNIEYAQYIMQRFEDSFNSVNGFSIPAKFEMIDKTQLKDYLSSGNNLHYNCSFKHKHYIKVKDIRGVLRYPLICSELKLLLKDNKIIPVVILSFPRSIVESQTLMYEKSLKLVVFANGENKFFVLGENKLNVENLENIIREYELPYKIKQYNSLKKIIGKDFNMTRKEFISRNNAQLEDFYSIAHMLTV